MAGTFARRIVVLSVTIGFLSLLAGCGGKSISTSVAEQTFVPGQPQKAEAPAVAESKPEAPPVEPPPPPPPAPATPVEEPAPVAAAPPPAMLAAPLELTDVYFDYDRFTIRSDAEASLEANARALKSELKAEKGWTLLIEGHCDERGTAAYNLVLGEKRARAAKRYLVDLGIADSRIQIISYGKERPFCREHRDACWQKNRRAHFALK